MPSFTYHKQCSFEPIGFAITEKVAYNQDRQNKQNNHKDLKVQVHGLSHSQTDEDNQGGVEECCLDRRTQAVIQSDINDTVWKLC